MLAGPICISLPEQTLQATPTLANCPDCSASLSVVRIIPGRAGAEYWTMRCSRCGGIHLDIINPSTVPMTA